MSVEIYSPSPGNSAIYIYIYEFVLFLFVNYILAANEKKKSSGGSDAKSI